MRRVYSGGVPAALEIRQLSTVTSVWHSQGVCTRSAFQSHWESHPEGGRCKQVSALLVIIPSPNHTHKRTYRSSIPPPPPPPPSLCFFLPLWGAGGDCSQYSHLWCIWCPIEQVWRCAQLCGARRWKNFPLRSNNPPLQEQPAREDAGGHDLHNRANVYNGLCPGRSA